MNFAGKWMELESIILSEATQSQNNMHGMYSLIRDNTHNVQNIHDIPTDPRILNKTEGPREDA